LAFIDLPISFHQTPNLGFWPKLTIQTNLFCYPSLESSKSLSGTHQQILLKYFCLKWCLIFPLFMQNMPVVKCKSFDLWCYLGTFWEACMVFSQHSDRESSTARFVPSLASEV
uniref:Uncharacterized protein n=1 Tax=Solanum lycopersicum TaxID=4081 RepID=A0A3Q7FM76_SOLLC